MKSDKKKSIYLAAAKLFGEKGFEGTSLDKVAEKAGVAKGTIFYHFRNKEELFSQLIEEGVNTLSTEIEKIYEKDMDIEQKLDLLVDLHFNFFRQHRDLCLMMLGQIGSFQKRWQKSVDLIRNKYLVSMEKIITQAKENNIIDEKLETESLIISLFSLLAVTSIDWAIFHPGFPQEKMAETVRSLLKNGFIKQ
jgi:AcrR family transcriptional regulator